MVKSIRYFCEVQAKHFHNLGREMQVDPSEWLDMLSPLIDYWSVPHPYSKEGAWALLNMLHEKDIPGRIRMIKYTDEIIHEDG